MNNYNIYYLTHNICLKNQKLMYESNSILKEIKNNTWHIHLKDYGWNKIDKKWIKRLNKYSKDKEKYSRWGVIDMGGNGDCLFHVIAEALNSLKYIDNKNIKNNKYYAYDIRKIASTGINSSNFKTILELYKSEYNAKEFIGLWKPLKIKSINDLKNEIITMGNNFWGDHIILQLLEMMLNIKFIILNKNSIKIHNTFTNINSNNNIILLYYTTSNHYELIGYYNNNYMQSIFNYSNLPTELLTIYRIDCKQ